MNLKQLSKNLGLSQTTVSRALNGYPEVAEETRRRVLEYARKMKYQPNSNARRLATGKSKTIGHVVPLASHDMINPHFSDFVAGACEVYNERGYDMLMSVVDSGTEGAIYEALNRNRRVDGVIVHGPTTDDRRVRLLSDLKMPFVVHGRTEDPEESYAWVDVNNRRSFEHATRYLLELGHRRIALINGLEHMNFAARRRQGFEIAFEDYGVSPDPELMASDEMIEPNGYDAMTRFLDADRPPTAVLCSSILTAMGAMRAMRDRGLALADDISLIGYDDCLSFLPSSGEHPSLTVMRSGIRVAGRHCAEILIDQIEKVPHKRHLLLKAEFVVGASTAPPKRATV